MLRFYIALLLIFSVFFLPAAPESATAETGALPSPRRLAKPTQDPVITTIIKKIRHSNRPNNTRIVVDLSETVPYVVTQDTPSQTLLVRLEKTTLGKSLRQNAVIPITGNLIKKIEVTQKGEETVYISLRYKQLGTHTHLMLNNPSRLVIDVYPPETSQVPFSIETIVIDAGHGGKDPGARNKSLQEKDLTLDISKRLKTLVETQLKKKVIMTRDRDEYVSLKKRTEIANENNADLFVSVHINASTSDSLEGIEVYLIGRASDKRAMEVAARENAEIPQSDVDFEKMILSDLEREFTRNASLELAHFTHDALKENLISRYPTNALGVKRAPFYVLNHTQMPAILAEISFISNRKEAQRLKNAHYRQRAAEALLKGIEAYIHSLETRS